MTSTSIIAFPVELVIATTVDLPDMLTQRKLLMAAHLRVLHQEKGILPT